MQVGVVFPQTEIGQSAEEIKSFARAVEEMGFTHILAYDHVLGANIASRPHWRGKYDLSHAFQEPFVLFSFLAGVTNRIGFATGIIILPQRQTALVAKQAACLDVLSNGRLRLGVGTGWNQLEYEALGMQFGDRGMRYEEQIDVLRALWTKPAVTFKSTSHTINDAGINPLPVQQPIPVWMGGGTARPDPTRVVPSEAVLRRIARIADGWMPTWQPGDVGRAELARFHRYCREYGRDPESVGIEGRMMAHLSAQEPWRDTFEAWRSIGASHLSINTMGDGIEGAAAHLRRLEAFRYAVPLA